MSNKPNPNKQTIYVMVETTAMDEANPNGDEKLIRERAINYSLASCRRWLAKHAWWAMHNNYTLVTYPIDYETYAKVRAEYFESVKNKNKSNEPNEPN